MDTPDLRLGAPSTPPVAGSPFGGLFGTELRDPTLEAEYRALHLPHDGRAAAVTVLIVAVLAIPFTLSDRVFIHDPGTLLWLTMLRIGGWIAAAAGILVMWRSRRPLVVDLTVVIWNLLNVGLNVAIQTTRPPDYHLQFATDLMYLTMAWTVIPNRFVFQCVAALGATLTSVGIMLWVREPLPVPARFFVGTALFAVNLAGILVALRLHRTRRQAFVDNRAACVARDELALALAEVKTLRGLVPICSNCKAIRDTEGQWKSLEEVLLTSTEATLSHGMCPACIQRLYPDFA